MRKQLICLAIFLSAVVPAALAQPADAIVGTWLNAEQDAKIQIYKTGSTYQGKLIWGKNIYEADGKTSKKDVNNADASLRNRDLLNLIILTGFTYGDGAWENGKVYDPKNGKTYSCVMKLNDGKRELRGYVGISLLGRTTVWTKAT